MHVISVQLSLCRNTNAQPHLFKSMRKTRPSASNMLRINAFAQTRFSQSVSMHSAQKAPKRTSFVRRFKYS